MASHVRLDLSIESPSDPEQVHHTELTIRTDLLSMPAGRRRDAALSITMHRLMEQFWATYNAACGESTSV